MKSQFIVEVPLLIPVFFLKKLKTKKTGLLYICLICSAWVPGLDWAALVWLVPLYSVGCGEQNSPVTQTYLVGVVESQILKVLQLITRLNTNHSWLVWVTWEFCSPLPTLYKGVSWTRAAQSKPGTRTEHSRVWDQNREERTQPQKFISILLIRFNITWTERNLRERQT